MIQVRRYKISASPAWTDFILQLNGQIKFYTSKAGQFSTWYLFRMVFFKNFSLYPCQFMKTQWWNPLTTFLNFFLTDDVVIHAVKIQQKYLQSIKICWYAFSQTDVLINFFIRLRWTEMIKRENFVLTK